jgi:hypothetical protein
MKRRIKKIKQPKKLGRMAAPQKVQKRLGPFEKPLKMTEMCRSLTCNTTNSLKYKRRRIRKRRIAPTRRLRRDKKRRIRRE